MEAAVKETDNLSAIINNIPVEYHSADLRNYFSQFIEEKGFECFHFRHRPEQVQADIEHNVVRNLGVQNSGTYQKRSACCVIKIKPEKLRKFMRMYHRKHWIDRKGEMMRQICYISKIRQPSDAGNSQFLTRAEQKLIPQDREAFTLADLHKLPELNPPDIMPNGNVGTPTMYFLDLIKQCRLPPSVIKKLGLTFPKTKSIRKYGNVSFDYGGEVISIDDSDGENDLIYTASGHQIPAGISKSDEDGTERVHEFGNNSSDKTVCDGSKVDKTDRSRPSSTEEPHSKKKKKKKSYIDKEMRRRMDLRIEEKMIGEKAESEEDNDSCEEWERHEALYDDPSNQERNKERLFEEEIELKWEKGGSGLVFYTDAQYWQALEGDFDEQTADDWDVDMSGYYEEGGGDKDARDYLTMRQEKRRRDGIEATDRFTAGIAKRLKSKYPRTERQEKPTKIGEFEGHTKGIGRKLLEAQGWTEGEGLGSSVQGIADALDNEGQNPRDRTGLGYHGEKLNRYQHRPAQRKVIISTIYDDHKLTDPHEPPLRRHEPYTLKYRDEIQFSKAEDS